MTRDVGGIRRVGRSWHRWSWWVAGVVLAVVGNPALWWNGTESLGALRHPDAIGTALTLLAALPLCVGRRLPLAALGVSTAALFTYDAMGYVASPVDLAPLILLGWVVIESSPLVTAAATAATLVAATAAGLIRPGSHSVASLAGDTIVIPMVALVGVALRSRRDRMRVTEAERELRLQSAFQEAEQLLLAERFRLARELHDSVGHGVTLMALQAAAAASLVRRDPDRARELLGQVEHASQDTVEELHQMLGVLRDPDQVPALSDRYLETLCRRFSVPGLQVDLEIDDEARDLPENLVDVIPAVVAEGLANVCRHADAGRATVRVHNLAQGLVVEVADDGRGPEANNHFGMGLTGAAERVRAVGGTLNFQPGPIRGSVLVAAFPAGRAAPA
jgi:signal transduction histidine kinase